MSPRSGRGRKAHGEAVGKVAGENLPSPPGRARSGGRGVGKGKYPDVAPPGLAEWEGAPRIPWLAPWAK